MPEVIIHRDGPVLRNHDSAYNILFTDNSVKSYSDAGRSLERTIQELPYAYGASTQLTETIFEAYFDGQYSMD